MPKKLFDTYMVKELSHLFELYLRSRSGSKPADLNLKALKETEVGIELENCRGILMGIEGQELRHSWLKHLAIFQTRCEEMVAQYNRQAGTAYSSGGLVTDYIAEAKLFLSEAEPLFILFGLDQATDEKITPEIFNRYQLFELCMKRLYYPGSMKDKDWVHMAQFRREMVDFCGVAAAQDKEVVKDDTSRKSKASGSTTPPQVAESYASRGAGTVSIKEVTSSKEAPSSFKSFAKLERSVATILGIEEGILKKDAALLNNYDPTDMFKGAASFMVRTTGVFMSSASQAVSAVYQWMSGSATGSPVQLSKANVAAIDASSSVSGSLKKSSSTHSLSSTSSGK